MINATNVNITPTNAANTNGVVEKATIPDGTSKFSKSLLPQKYIENLAKNETHLKNYRATLAMAIALGAMCITNFVLDAPLTIILTNLLNKKSGVRHTEENVNLNQKEREVYNV